MATAHDTPIATVFPNVSYASVIRGTMQEAALRNSAACIDKRYGIPAADHTGFFSVGSELLAVTDSTTPLNAPELRLITAGLQAVNRRRVYCWIPLPVASGTGRTFAGSLSTLSRDG